MYGTKIITVIFGLFMLISGDQLHTRQFKIKEHHDDVVISYRWGNPRLFHKNTPIRLILELKNHNPHRVLISFRVNFYWGGILSASSEKVEYCLKPRRKIRGKMWGLVFSTGKFSEEQISDDRFLWEISELEIRHHADCKTRLNVSIKADPGEPIPNIIIR